MENCKSKLLLLVFVLVAYFHLSQQIGVITIPEGSTNWFDVKAQFDKVVFQVQGNTVIVPNNHRANSSLKFSLGSSIVLIEPTTWKSVRSSWELHLHDKSSVIFSLVEHWNSTSYDLLWHGGGPNGPQREVCFHTNFNNATWFDTYQPRESASWPMKITENEEQIPFNFLFRSHNEQVGELIFYNSDGFAVVLDEEQPLYFRRQAGEVGVVKGYISFPNQYLHYHDQTLRYGTYLTSMTLL